MMMLEWMFLYILIGLDLRIYSALCRQLMSSQLVSICSILEVRVADLNSS